jgi:hypothetical protein
MHSKLRKPCASMEASQSPSDLLSEIERLTEAALARADHLRGRMRDSVEVDTDEASQLSLALDTLLQLKMSKDLLQQSIALDMAQLD